MKTVVFYEKETLGIEETPIPEVPVNKLLIRVLSCAICTWEQRVYTGEKQVDYPFIGGHEIAGEIVAIGAAVEAEFSVGDRVAYGTNLACGKCYYCRIGEVQNCLHFDHSQHQYGLPYHGMGGLSEYLVVSPEHIFTYHSVSPHEAALTEPLSCVIHSIESVDIRLGDYVLVVGCGIMGLLHVQLARKRGAIVIVSDPDQNRLKLAKKVGADYMIQPNKENLFKQVMLFTEQLGAQFIFDTTPVPKVIPESLTALAPTGSFVLYSSLYPNEAVPVQLDGVHKQGQKLVGTANSNAQDFIRASRLISHGIIDMKPFITNVYPIEKVKLAFDEAVNTNAFRVVVDFTDRGGNSQC